MFFIQDKVTGVILYQGRSEGELYEIPVKVFSRRLVADSPKAVALLGKAVKALVWHKRFGHPYEEVMSIMLRNFRQSVSTDSSPMVCSSCLSGKMCRQPFPVKETRASVLFEKVHSDIWGPTPTKSLEGFRYYVSFIDEFSRFLWIFPIVNKSDVFQVFINFHSFVATQFNAPIKCLQTDGGSEYLSTKFKAILASKGIIHFISCPYTPQQNGLAERKHRHLVETAITILTDANIPLQFWNFACNHAAFLINRMPCKTLGMKSPYQLLFHKDPVLHTLKFFGSGVYPFLRPYNHNKLQPRSKLCVFLGFAAGYKGVVCYDRGSNKLILSRHVIHDESVFPYKTQGFPVNGNAGRTQHANISPLVVQVFNYAPNSHDELSQSGEQQPIDPATVEEGLSPTTHESSFGVLHTSDAIHDTTNRSHVSSTGLPAMQQVHEASQLEVILPMSYMSSSSDIHAETGHPMTTRIKSGAIPKRFYTGCLASCPELQTLQLDDEFQVSGGFSFLAAIKDSDEPSTFR